MSNSLVTFPTNVGEIVIEFAYVGPVHNWKGPGVFFTLNGTPICSVVMRDGEAVIDILGHEPDVFTQLPADVQDAAQWWQAMLKLMHGAWSGYVRARIELDATAQQEAA